MSSTKPHYQEGCSYREKGKKPQVWMRKVNSHTGRMLHHTVSGLHLKGKLSVAKGFLFLFLQ